MVGTGTGGTQSALAQIDVPMSGNILNVDWQVIADLDADAEYIEAQLSFGSAHALANDSRMLISVVQGAVSVLTAVGFAPKAFGKNHPISIPVSMGERLWLHVDASAGVNSVVVVGILFDFDLDKMLTRRR